MKTKLPVLLLVLALACKAEHFDRPEQSAALDGATVEKASIPAPPPPPPPSRVGLAQVAGVPPAIPRVIIRNAEISLVVSDAQIAFDRLTALAAASGGFVADSRLWRDHEQLRGSITLRVPASGLGDAMAAARKLASRVQSESVSGEDVTQEYVDLQAQVRNLEAAEVELRQLMTTVRERAKKAEDILEVYQQLTNVRGEIEKAKGRMQTLSQLSAMATLKVELIPDAVAQPVVEPGWQPVAVARHAAHNLVATLQTAGSAAIWIVIYVLPVGGVLALIAFGIRSFVKAVKRRRRSVTLK
jgi:hypothetical protein